MDGNDDFHVVWRQLQGKAEGDQLPLCRVATEFSRKIEDVIFAPLGEEPRRTQIAQAKYMLQEEWHAWRKSIPQWHLRRATGLHRCLDDVYEACYDRLHLLDLTSRPPLNLLLDYYEKQNNQLPLPQPQLNIAGIPLGELEEEEE